ncbi:unnamed protein product [Medioppia subpectinata]|uniref:E3 ubiquitin-protein ligase PPP1R11 n=1 Tax=Medioppia subpectinata TaxID=1979941 RepID=A0A7R9Q5U7_9ACAR|nr:unnamed protein product [Medioppia subpectinata]CAG2113215.1 unnamed protein product [Medioppia subpectinata]
MIKTSRDVTDGSSSAAMRSPVLRLRLKKPSTVTAVAAGDRKKVSFSDSVVDNEGLGRKKSKCCCVYHKPRLFDDGSSTDSDDSDDCPESDHCFGHKKRPTSRKRGPNGTAAAAADDGLHPMVDVEDMDVGAD